MAGYGFGNNNKGWKESKKGILSKALRQLVDDMEGEGKFVGLTRGLRPYVLADEPSRGSNNNEYSLSNKRVSAPSN